MYELTPIKSYLQALPESDLHKIAEQTGVSFHTLKHIRNKPANPTIRTCAAIAKYIEQAPQPEKAA